VALTAPPPTPPRRIVKARRPGPGSGLDTDGEAGGKPASNPFASLSLGSTAPATSAPVAAGAPTAANGGGSATSKPSVFGSAFPGVSASAMLASASTSASGFVGGFGGGFGSYKQNPLQAALGGAPANPFASSPSVRNPFEAGAEGAKPSFSGFGAKPAAAEVCTVRAGQCRVCLHCCVACETSEGCVCTPAYARTCVRA
jgi:hypothetical protein